MSTKSTKDDCIKNCCKILNKTRIKSNHHIIQNRIVVYLQFNGHCSNKTGAKHHKVQSPHVLVFGQIPNVRWTKKNSVFFQIVSLSILQKNYWKSGIKNDCCVPLVEHDFFEMKNVSETLEWTCSQVPINQTV